MEPLQFLATHTAYPDAEAFSALPHAPVRPDPAPAVRAPRVRLGLAAALHRLADAVAPPRGIYAGGRSA